MATEETNTRPDPDREWRIADLLPCAYKIFEVGFGEGSCRVVLNAKDRPTAFGPPELWDWSARATFDSEPNRGISRNGQAPTAEEAMRAADAAWPEMLVDEVIQIKQRADRAEARARQEAEVRETLLAAMRAVNAENTGDPVVIALAAPEG